MIIINNEKKHSGPVRLIGEDGEQLGIIDVAEALKIANERKLDLVLVSPKANPPVCKILNAGKIKYQQSKKQKSQRQKDRKEVRLSVRIEEHDLLTKMKQVQKFLKKGHEVNVNVLLKGREKAHPESAVKVLQSFLERLQEDLPLKLMKAPTQKNNKADMILLKGDKKDVVSKVARNEEGGSEGYSQ